MKQITLGLCQCGCGQTTDIANGTVRRNGWVKGQPKRFIHGHNSFRYENPNTTGVCQCGCGIRTPLAKQTDRKRNRVIGMPLPFAPGHANRLKQRKPIEQRFWKKVEKGDPNECWMWKGKPDPKGYGRFWVINHNVPAHRFAWECVNGTMPKGMEACHKCDNPPCCNPNHIFQGTSADNTADKVSKNRQRGKAHIPYAIVQQMRTMVKNGSSQTSVADQFHVHQSTVNKIVKGTRRVIPL